MKREKKNKKSFIQTNNFLTIKYKTKRKPIKIILVIMFIQTNNFLTFQNKITEKKYLQLKEHLSKADGVEGSYC